MPHDDSHDCFKCWGGALWVVFSEYSLYPAKQIPLGAILCAISSFSSPDANCGRRLVELFQGLPVIFLLWTIGCKLTDPLIGPK